MSDCELCVTSTLPILWQNNCFRVILVNNQNIRGYLRLELIEHVKEIHHLNPTIQSEMYKIMNIIENIVTDVYNPDKINLASLGNKTPHIHWHIIPRFTNDNFFPQSIWSEPVRQNKFENSIDEINQLKQQLHVKLNH
ncbi:HIT family protein [Methylophilaceae bacterium]|nr:HIT family protein [Methylophilaceae bacterium]